jgi:hypothetical protein
MQIDKDRQDIERDWRKFDKETQYFLRFCVRFDQNSTAAKIE